MNCRAQRWICVKLGTDLVAHRQACGTRHPDPGQQNATPQAKKRNPDKKSMEGTRSIVWGRGSELFSGLRFFCLGAVLYVISPYKFFIGFCYCVLYIHPVQCARLFLDAWLVDRSARVSANVNARVRIPLSAIFSHLSGLY